MLTIRREQMLVFDQAFEQQFCLYLAGYIRRKFPSHVRDTSDEQLRQYVHITVTRGKSFGLKSRRDLCRLSVLAACAGWDFLERERWIQRRLADPAIASPSERLRLVYDEYIHRLRLSDGNRNLRARALAGGTHA